MLNRLLIIRKNYGKKKTNIIWIHVYIIDNLAKSTTIKELDGSFHVQIYREHHHKYARHEEQAE